ncbi:MAG: hypothetical protein CMK59_13665 [Proteobacteria bacterium]|nr:hypothetical protein [Pseudomonadota bacterium]
MIGGLAFALAYPNPFTTFKDYPPPKAPYTKGLTQNTPYWYFNKENCTATLLIAHGRSHNKSYMSPLIDAVWSTSSLCIMAIDLPNHGERPYGTTTIGLTERHGILEALSWLEENHNTPVLLYGVSMGGSAIIHTLALHQPPTVIGAITDGTYSSLDLLISNMKSKLLVPQYITNSSRALVEHWANYTISDVRPEDLTAQIKQPLLIIHGNKDWLAPPISAKNLALQAPNALSFWYEGTHDKPQNPILHTLVLSFIDVLSEEPLNWQESYMTHNMALYQTLTEE